MKTGRSETLHPRLHVAHLEHERLTARSELLHLQQRASNLVDGVAEDSGTVVEGDEGTGIGGVVNEAGGAEEV
ncbi:hypothetical protein U1Q18_015886 [Sarracenia purpurea var. burkii]